MPDCPDELIAGDDLSAAMAAYSLTAGQPGLPAYDGTAPREFFLTRFRWVTVSNEALITAYYQPELPASRVRTDEFSSPLHALPLDLASRSQSRSQIDQGALDGAGLEIAWLASPFDVFLCQVQGSARLRLGDGTQLRLGYAGRNGLPYRSIGQEMIRKGLIPETEISIRTIRATIGPDHADQVIALRHNPSYVYFRVIECLDENEGPIGTAGVPLTAGRSLAVDFGHVPMGWPVWVETKSDTFSANSLFIAQDTGGAIKGHARLDLYLGSGEAAGDLAGQIRQTGKMIVLCPIGQDLPQVGNF